MELAGSMSAYQATFAAGPRGSVITAQRWIRSDSAQRCPFDIDYSVYAYYSPDGISWEPESSPPSRVDEMLADESGFIAVGTDSDRACRESEERQQIWSSADGREWHQLTDGDWVGREIDVLLSSGERLLGIGNDWTGGDYPAGGAGTIWTVDRAQLATD